MNNNKTESGAIGIFDSGFGGLTIMQSLIELLPNEDFIYFGDSINAPYGNKGKEEIVRLSLEGADFLLKKKIKALVVGCNTACVYAYNEIKNKLPIPVIEIVSPTYLGLSNYFPKDKIGVLATKATISSNVYRKLILQNFSASEVFSLSCPLFVPLIEEGFNDFQKIVEVVNHYLLPLKRKNIDLLLLACTHFPLIKSIIQVVMGEKVKIIDPSFFIAEAVRKLLIELNLVEKNSKRGQLQFFTSGNVEKFKVIAERILNLKIDNVKKKDDFF